jgi:hypothetical protein
MLKVGNSFTKDEKNQRYAYLFYILQSLTITENIIRFYFNNLFIILN